MTEQTARVIAEITGCTPDQTQAVIAALLDAGWTPPGETACSDEPATPGPGGWGVVYSLDGAVVAEFSGAQDATTNNRMELTAAREAIARAPSQVSLEIVTDSKNVIGWLSQGWKRNDPTIARICKEIDEVRRQRTLAKGGAVTFKYVRGHNGDVFNERVDKLATGAIAGTKRV